MFFSFIYKIILFQQNIYILFISSEFFRRLGIASASLAPPPPRWLRPRLSLVAMETRGWQHPAVCSASILIPLRGAAECVRPRHRYVTHSKMANARRMACFALYVGLGKLFSRLLRDINTASLSTLRGASLRYVTQRPMLM